MTQNQVRVPFGQGQELVVPLPDSWRVIGVYKPNPVPVCPDVADEVKQAIDRPIGTESLARLAKGAGRVAVVVDDLTRPTPVESIFAPVMTAIESAGVRPEQVTVIFALGVHRPMTDREMADRIGEAGFARYTCINHDANPGDHLVNLGRTGNGSQVWIHRVVAQADLVVSIGCIEPHSIAGFGGGYKNLSPGVAGKVTIAANHALNTSSKYFNGVGTEPEQNPMRRDLEECGAMVPGKVFVVNAILDGNQKVVKIVAGDPVAAHRQGIATSREIFGVEIPEQADVVIISSHPFNIDLRAGFKAMSNLLQAARPGGILINLMAAQQGLGDMTMPRRKIYAHKPVVRLLTRAILPMVKVFNFGLKEEDKFFVYFALQAMKRNDLYFYSPNMPAEFARRLPFMDFHDSLEVVMAKAERAMPRADVLVFPAGGVTYPILPDKNPERG